MLDTGPGCGESIGEAPRGRTGHDDGSSGERLVAGRAHEPTAFRARRATAAASATAPSTSSGTVTVSRELRRWSVGGEEGVELSVDAVGAERQGAPGAELGEERPLGGDGEAGRRIVDSGEQVCRHRVVGAALHGNTPLADSGDEDCWVESFGDALGHAEHFQCGHRHHDRAAVGDLLEPPGDVAAQLDELQVRANACQLGPPAHRPRRHDGSRGELGERPADEGVGCVTPGREGGQPQAGRRFAREVLGRMHGGLGAAIEHGLLDLLDEHTLAADRVQGYRLVAVTGRLDEQQLGGPSGRRGDRLGEEVGLGPGLWAPPGRQPQRCPGHPSA